MKNISSIILGATLALSVIGAVMLGTTTASAKGFDRTPSVTLVATKIVCDKESDLPNWGLGGHSAIGQHTATSWVATHTSCRLASGWNFQYAGSNSSYPGDTLIGSAAGFTTFGATGANGKAVTIIDLKGDLKNEIHVREVQKEGYIPFTYQTAGNKNTNNVSAEIYCSDDVINYDNFDFIRNPSDDETYYCVAWNVQKETTKQQCTDGVDNDGNGAKDLADNNCAAWRPSVNVIKHVVGGTSVAGNFTLHLTNSIAFAGSESGVNTIFSVAPQSYSVTEDAASNYTATLSGDCQGTLQAGDHKTCTVTNTYVPPVVVDLCPNLEGTQTIIPEGYQLSEGQCVVIVPPQVCPEGTIGIFPVCVPTEQPTDVCSNLEGAQLTVPEGYQLSEGQCVVVVPPQACPEGTTGVFPNCTQIGGGDSDVCSNLEGVQTTIPEGYQLSEGQCVVTPTDNPTPPSGGSGSSNFDYWGCINPQATNFNSLANKDDGSCIVPHSGTTGGAAAIGEVLGASTTTEPTLPAGCAPYLTDYLRQGKHNDIAQVKLLQQFLNEYMDAKLPVSGIFGNLTKNWVKKFQVKHHDEIIKPWYDAGYKSKDIENGTGIVYKTTKYEINLLKCSSNLTEKAPDLTPDL